MGIAVLDANGQPCAGISVGVPAVRFTQTRERNIATHLETAAGEISQRLGWVPERSLAARASLTTFGA
jgi:DNA-binding IclR family transcriptional regulator